VTLSVIIIHSGRDYYNLIAPGNMYACVWVCTHACMLVCVHVCLEFKFLESKDHMVRFPRVSHRSYTEPGTKLLFPVYTWMNEQMHEWRNTSPKLPIPCQAVLWEEGYTGNQELCICNAIGLCDTGVLAPFCSSVFIMSCESVDSKVLSCSGDTLVSLPLQSLLSITSPTQPLQTQNSSDLHRHPI
jgi:hypothetical protein